MQRNTVVDTQTLTQPLTGTENRKLKTETHTERIWAFCERKQTWCISHYNTDLKEVFLFLFKIFF